MSSQPVNVLAITHGPMCFDGAASAFVIDRFFKTKTDGNNYNVTHFRVNPANAFDAIREKFGNSANTFNHVISCDVGYSGKDLQSLIALFPSVKVIDHHISSFRDIARHYNPDKNFTEESSIASIYEANAIFPEQYLYNNDKSGAMLAWEYLNPGTDAPDTIKYIQDNDLYKFTLPDSKMITKGIFVMLDSNPNGGWDSWTDFVENEKTKLVEAKEIGKVVVMLNKKRIEELSGKVVKFAYVIDGKTYTGAHLNTSELVSDLGNYIVNMKDAAGNYMYDFAAMWSYDDSNTGNYYCSLRSRGDLDISTICRKFGGGGHAAAGAMTISCIQQLTA